MFHIIHPASHFLAISENFDPSAIYYLVNRFPLNSQVFYYKKK